MKRTFQMMVAAVVLATAAAASAPASPSGIRPGRPPDPLGGRAAAACRQAESAPGGWWRIPAAPLPGAEGGRL